MGKQEKKSSRLINKKKLILVELNELNFDYAKKYIDSGVELKNIQKIIQSDLRRTSSESEYEHLEPWIQWTSVHTGKSFSEHNIFRLGDIVQSKDKQIFEVIESLGYSVGCISPMNAANNLKNPDFFIPDPWTNTKSDESWLSKILSRALKQAVNDNAKRKISFTTFIDLSIGFLLVASFKNYWQYLGLLMTSILYPWRRAIFLDLFLYDIHRYLISKHQTDFSTIFFNAGAHIQHHYLLSSKIVNDTNLKNPDWYIREGSDPFKEILTLYNMILGEFLTKYPEYQIVICTGLKQVVYDSKKYYYRLSNHEKFLGSLGLSYEVISPRMSRDFDVSFKTDIDAIRAQTVLQNIVVQNNKKPLFGLVSRTGNSLFITLTYPDEITLDTKITSNGLSLEIFHNVVFVAPKNGMHSSEGYLYLSPKIDSFKFIEYGHVKQVFRLIYEFFSQDLPIKMGEKSV